MFAILATAEEYDSPLRIISSAVEVNTKRPAAMVEKIRAALGGEIKGRTVALLGLAFKPNTDDVRESAALKIALAILEEGGRVKAFDPVAMERACAAGFTGECADDEYAACEGADAVVIATEWNQFRNLDLDRVRGLVNEPVLVDLRDVYEPDDMAEKGFRYSAVGR